MLCLAFSAHSCNCSLGRARECKKDVHEDEGKQWNPEQNLIEGTGVLGGGRGGGESPKLKQHSVSYIFQANILSLLFFNTPKSGKLRIGRPAQKKKPRSHIYKRELCGIKIHICVSRAVENNSPTHAEMHSV